MPDDLAAEIQSNLELETDDHLARGIESGEARAAARRHFGNTTLIQENARDAWTFPRLETFLQDLRYGLRAIRNSPGYSLVVILTLALGIGANTAIFSVVDSVLLKPLPYPDAERLVRLGESQAKAQGISVTRGNYLAWRKYNHSFEEMAGFQWSQFTLTGREEPLFTRALLADSSFFRLTGAHPLLGRYSPKKKIAPAPLVPRFWITGSG